MVARPGRAGGLVPDRGGVEERALLGIARQRCLDEVVFIATKPNVRRKGLAAGQSP
jgi:hypothetical protein